MQQHPIYHCHFVCKTKCDLDFAFLILKMLRCNILLWLLALYIEWTTPECSNTINILLNRVVCYICSSSLCDWKGHCWLISIIVIKDSTGCFFLLPKPLGTTARKHVWSFMIPMKCSLAPQSGWHYHFYPKLLPEAMACPQWVMQICEEAWKRNFWRSQLVFFI